MTKEAIVTDVAHRAKKSSEDALERIGDHVSRGYRRTLGTLGLLTLTRYVVDYVCVAGTMQEVENIEKIESIFDPLNDVPRQVDEISWKEMSEVVPNDGYPCRFAVKRHHASAVEFKLDATMDAGYALTITGTESNAILEDDDEPDFPERFHDILTEYALWQELLKDEKPAAKDAKKAYDDMLGELRLACALSNSKVIQQGKRNLNLRRGWTIPTVVVP